MKGSGNLVPIGMIFLGLILMPIPLSTAQSDNTPPLAEDDAYLTYLNTDLVVSAPGVLGNDSDPDNDPITAVLEDNDIEDGTLVEFNSDGSFTYRPATGFSGVETFTYRVFDNDGEGNESRVLITVSPNAPPMDPVDEIGETIETLEILIAEGEIQFQHAEALIKKLLNAITSVENGNVTPAINKLEAFLNQVNALINSGNIVNPDVGLELIDKVQSIIDIIDA